MVQSVSQYEFIYEYLLDYLSTKSLISLKFPRNRFGDEDSLNEEEEKQEPSSDSVVEHQMINLSIKSKSDSTEEVPEMIVPIKKKVGKPKLTLNIDE